jgi:hypothetical protein
VIRTGYLLHKAWQCDRIAAGCFGGLTLDNILKRRLDTKFSLSSAETLRQTDRLMAGLWVTSCTMKAL